jgi:hypothetical protein
MRCLPIFSSVPFLGSAEEYMFSVSKTTRRRVTEAPIHTTAIRRHHITGEPAGCFLSCSRLPVFDSLEQRSLRLQPNSRSRPTRTKHLVIRSLLHPRTRPHHLRGPCLSLHFLLIDTYSHPDRVSFQTSLSPALSSDKSVARYRSNSLIIRRNSMSHVWRPGLLSPIGGPGRNSRSRSRRQEKNIPQFLAQSTSGSVPSS